MKTLGCVAFLMTLTPVFAADSLPVGTWVRRDAPEPVHITMKIDPAGAGLKLTYTITSAQSPVPQIMTIVTQLDDKDAPTLVDGKPTGQTMAIRQADSRHATGVVKMQGQQMGTSNSEISIDGKVLKVENTTLGPDGKPTLRIEYWDKK